MIVKLLTEHYLELLSLKKAAEARPSLHLSKCQIVGNYTPRLIILTIQKLHIIVARIIEACPCATSGVCGQPVLSSFSLARTFSTQSTSCPAGYL